MKTNRSMKRKATSPDLKPHQLCNGPSKLCQALQITKDDLNQIDMTTSDDFYVVDDGHPPITDDQIVETTRIGIDSYGVEWASKPLRFYVINNKCVSVRNKNAEFALEKKS